MPQLKENKFIPKNVISFNERNGVVKPEDHWIDFFVDDDLFENFWRHPEKSFTNLLRFAGIITTDYSMFPELLPGQIIWNCTRNRVMSYYLQENGFKTIPVASWSSKEDFEWCFDGLPSNSSIAVSTNGCLASPYGKRIFLLGVQELQKRKNPYKLIVCGRQIKELDVYGNVLYYPCFSQRWKERAS